MFTILPALLKDGYKVGHKFQYPSDLTKIYSNFTPRNGRDPDSTGMVCFGIQYMLRDLLIDKWNQDFFYVKQRQVLAEYKRVIDGYLGPGAITIDHIQQLHDLGYLPLEIKALPEGTFTPYGVPTLTITNTLPDFAWLPNMLETVMSSYLWRPGTSATTAREYRKQFELSAELTGAAKEFIPWQGHDFSYRGMDPMVAASSGAGHLLFFHGTDTIPAIPFIEYFYGGLEPGTACSVPATEHSVMCAGGQTDEKGLFKRLLTEVYPKGIVSVVSDTWDLWQVLTEYLPEMKEMILARDGKLVIRPDSGDPVQIICGDGYNRDTPASRGVVQLLWDVFGGTTNSRGYRTLDPHVGVIYGDSITPQRQRDILYGLAANGFASDNIVLGIGSYTYSYVTRDTHGQAMKATYAETLSGGPISLFKKPVTDNGGKFSAKGLLKVVEQHGRLVLEQDVTPEQEQGGLLRTVFRDSKLFNQEDFKTIRERAIAQLWRI